jgi:lipopolysaccharide/colanic/teichoic acid biosynthesis glycosyltransferase
MTLVGPRPNSRFVSDYEPWQLERLSVRPGLTGPWQIHGERNVNYSERFADDIRYIRARTGRSDAIIVVQTILHCIRGRGFA